MPSHYHKQRKGRQPPKAPPKKSNVVFKNPQGYRTPEEAYRAADEAIARSQKIWEEYEASSREISQQAARRASYITTALGVGLGALAIGEAGRTIHNIRRGRAVAQAQALAQAQAQAQQRADNRRARASSNLEVLPHGALPAVATQETQEL